MSIVIHEDDSSSLETLVIAFGIVASNLDKELERWRAGHRTQGHSLHLATLAAASADLSGQINTAMLKAAGEFVPAALLAPPQ